MKIRSGNTSQRRVLQDLNGMLEDMYKYAGKPKEVFIKVFYHGFFNCVTAFLYFLILFYLFYFNLI